MGLARGDTHLGPGAEKLAGGEGGEASSGVHDDATGKVLDPPRAKPSARAPDPVAPRSVDEDNPKSDEDEVGSETQPVRESARHECRRDDCKHALVPREGEAWDTGDEHRPVGHGEGAAVDILVEPKGRRVTDDSAGRLTKA